MVSCVMTVVAGAGAMEIVVGVAGGSCGTMVAQYGSVAL